MEEAKLRKHRCCFTGHRPDKMTLGENDIKPLLENAIDKAIEDGYCALPEKIDSKKLQKTE